MTAKVYDLKTGRQVEAGKAANDALAVPRIREREAVSNMAGNIGRGALGVIRYVAFLVLYWLRGPLKFMLGIIAVPSLIALPMIAFGMESSQSKTEMMLWLFGAGFGSFVLSWFYDSLLLRLSPEPIFLN